MSLSTQPNPTPASPEVIPASGAPWAPQTPTSAPKNSSPSQKRYTVIFGVVAAVVTIAALLLSAATSALQPASSNGIPASWQRVYSHDLTAGDDSAWDETKGCSINGLGLDASASDSGNLVQCAFQPRTAQNATSAGFYFETQVGAAAKVPAFERAFITVGDLGDSPAAGAALHFVIGQDGAYVFCDGPCQRGASSVYESGSAVAWHGNAFVPNTVAVKVSPDHSLATVYLNSQEFLSAPVQLGTKPGIAVGATSGDEAVFTRATLYTGQ